MNITVIKGSPKVLLPGTSSSFSSIGSSLEKFPYNISLLAIDRVLIPAGVISGGSPPPAPVNLTQIISQSGNFSSFITSLRATGVDKVLQSHDAEPGLTIFAPTNAAFDRLGSAALRRLSSVQLVALLEFHALPSFYPTEELATANGPQPTLASGASAESFTITLSRNKAGTIIINAGGNKVAIAGTLYSNNPVAIFQINDVLMPEDIFGKAPESPPLPAPPPTLTPATPPSAATPAGLPRSFARAPSPAPLLAKPPSSSQSPVPNTSLTTSPATTPPSPLAPSDAFAPSEGPSALSPDSLASSSHVAASFSPLFLLFTVSVLLFYTM
ncbi:hypothetical protein KP509_06G037000 [Ceratopteris richardii]|nr:hypothetical protein KP509_06G037000 [Ceratopteris richardii]